MPSTYTLISSNVLTSSAASVTFSAIPSTYTDLVLRVSARGSDGGVAQEQLKYTFNGLGGTNYSTTYLYWLSASLGSTRTSSTSNITDYYINGSTSTANTFGSTEIYIPRYATATAKPISSFSVGEQNATGGLMGAMASLFNNTATITSITLSPNISSQFVSGSSFYLYGIKNS